jgi:hypothetical protein
MTGGSLRDEQAAPVPARRFTVYRCKPRWLDLADLIAMWAPRVRVTLSGAPMEPQWEYVNVPEPGNS